MEQEVDVEFRVDQISAHSSLSEYPENNYHQPPGFQTTRISRRLQCRSLDMALIAMKLAKKSTGHKLEAALSARITANDESLDSIYFQHGSIDDSDNDSVFVDAKLTERINKSHNRSSDYFLDSIYLRCTSVTDSIAKGSLEIIFPKDEEMFAEFDSILSTSARKQLPETRVRAPLNEKYKTFVIPDAESLIESLHTELDASFFYNLSRKLSNVSESAKQRELVEIITKMWNDHCIIEI